MDIVERLRDPESMYDADDVDLHLDAVDEIERLRGIINDDRLEGAADKIERLRTDKAELLGVLKDTMVWIDNWEPEFFYDLEWKDFEQLIRATIAKATGAD